MRTDNPTHTFSCNTPEDWHLHWPQSQGSLYAANTFRNPDNVRRTSHPCARMQSVSRQFGKLMRKGPGDNAKVSVLLSDYEDADKVLAQVRHNPPLPAPGARHRC